MSFDFGTFVISLDFELMWGVLDHADPMDYRENILGARKAVPGILKQFDEYDIHATWGIVGLLARSDMKDCMLHSPGHFPEYLNDKLSPYGRFSDLQNTDKEYFFAGELISLISETAGQELASHTYSHYYCMESGQTAESFADDIELFREVMASYDENVTSIIFPRNQFNSDYGQLLKENGLKNYRGNEKSWYYGSADTKGSRSPLRRVARLLDNYISISGNGCYGYAEIPDENGLNDIRSSRFFRPYTSALSFAEPMRLHRIKKQMEYAARNNMVFHLWWHPHNFGKNTDKNLDNLKNILNYYVLLKEKYGMRSLNMGELGEML